MKTSMSILFFIALFSVRTGAEETHSIEENIRIIGDSGRFDERETAQEELISFGVTALPAVKQAQKDFDPERRRRAQFIEKEILDNLAWTPKPINIHRTDSKLSDVFFEWGEHQRVPVVFGDPEGILGIPENKSGNYGLSGVSWDAIEKLCRAEKLDLFPRGNNGSVVFSVVELNSDTQDLRVIESGIRFSCAKNVQVGTDPNRLVFNLTASGDAERAIFAASAEAFVLHAVTDTGEELTRLRNFNLGLEAARYPHLYTHATFAQIGAPKKPCSAIAKLELELTVACLVAPMSAELPSLKIGNSLVFPDGSEWRLGGYTRNIQGGGDVLFVVSGQKPLPKVLGQPVVYLSGPLLWHSSFGATASPKGDGDWLCSANFAPGAINEDRSLQIRYYTRVIYRQFHLTFENLPFHSTGTRFR